MNVVFIFAFYPINIIPFQFTRLYKYRENQENEKKKQGREGGWEAIADIHIILSKQTFKQNIDGVLLNLPHQIKLNETKPNICASHGKTGVGKDDGNNSFAQTEFSKQWALNSVFQFKWETKSNRERMQVKRKVVLAKQTSKQASKQENKPYPLYISLYRAICLIRGSAFEIIPSGKQTPRKEEEIIIHTSEKHEWRSGISQNAVVNIYV